MRKLLFLIAAITLLLAPPAFAWGERGHRLIADLAYARLTPAARAAVDHLTRNNASATPECPVHSFPEAALWSDCVRAIPAYRNQSPWHYDNIPLCGASDYALYCPHGDCASAAIARAMRTLTDARASERDQARALARLVHFIGDIHQPLHAIDNGDRGGNSIAITITPSGAWSPGADGPRNLHAAWDRLLVDYALGPDEQEGRAAIAALMNAHAQDWSRGTARDWALETHALAAASAYGALPAAPVCGAPPSQALALDVHYAEANAPIIRRQLARAALRLAAALNTIYR